MRNYTRAKVLSSPKKGKTTYAKCKHLHSFFKNSQKEGEGQYGIILVRKFTNEERYKVNYYDWHCLVSQLISAMGGSIN